MYNNDHSSTQEGCRMQQPRFEDYNNEDEDTSTSQLVYNNDHSSGRL